VAAAAAVDVAHGEMHSVGSADFRAFEEWRSMTAAVATTAEGSEEDGEWDDQDYALGAVALPVGHVASGPAVHVAAAGTRAGAEKAKATRAAAKGRSQDGGGGRALAPVRRAGGVGTSLIAGPGDEVATSILRGRRDKAAAKERMAKLPDHGRQVAPQGLNRLPAGFPIRTVGPSEVPADGAPPVTRLAPLQGDGVQPPGPCDTPQVSAGPDPALAGGVQVQVGVFLELALRAGMDLAAVVALTVPTVPTVTAPTARPRGSHQQELVTLAALERAAPRALAQQAGAMLGLSPIARRAQAATKPAAPRGGSATEPVVGSRCAGSTGQANPGVLESAGAAGGSVTVQNPGVNGLKQLEGLAGPGQVVSPTYRGAVIGEDAPESSAMGAARGAQRVTEIEDAALVAPGCVPGEARPQGAGDFNQPGCRTCHAVGGGGGAGKGYR
jgi:hypothetical protein